MTSPPIAFAKKLPGKSSQYQVSGQIRRANILRRVVYDQKSFVGIQQHVVIHLRLHGLTAHAIAYADHAGKYIAIRRFIVGRTIGCAAGIRSIMDMHRILHAIQSIFQADGHFGIAVFHFFDLQFGG